MPINLDSAILSSKTGTYIINVLLTTDLLLKLYKEGKTPSQERVDHLEKLIREIESKRIKAIRSKNIENFVLPNLSSTLFPNIQKLHKLPRM